MYIEHQSIVLDQGLVTVPPSSSVSIVIGRIYPCTPSTMLTYWYMLTNEGVLDQGLVTVPPLYPTYDAHRQPIGIRHRAVFLDEGSQTLLV